MKIVQQSSSSIRSVSVELLLIMDFIFLFIARSV
jgi:hypothetical protein